jgi:hypothetical protein
MFEQPPITPPPELVRQWSIEAEQNHQPTVAYSLVTVLATRAAQWGADQQLKLDAEQIEKAYQAGADHELEACCEWFQEFYKTESWGKSDLKHFRAARRPKPPSLKERALHELAAVYNRDEIDDSAYDAIRRALEALPDD